MTVLSRPRRPFLPAALLVLAALVALAGCDSAEPDAEPPSPPLIEGEYFAHAELEGGPGTVTARLVLAQSGRDLTGEIGISTRGPDFTGHESDLFTGTYDHPRLLLDLPGVREARGTVSDDGLIVEMEVEYWALGEQGSMEIRVREVTFERPPPYTPPAVLPPVSGTYSGRSITYGVEGEAAMTLSERADGVVTGTVHQPGLDPSEGTPVHGRHDHPALTLRWDGAHPQQDAYFVGEVSADGTTLTGRFGTPWYFPTYVLTRQE